MVAGIRMICVRCQAYALALIFLLSIGCDADDRFVSPSLDPRTHRVIPLQLPFILNSRPIWVYLPPGYPARDTRYPVLYVHDGQHAFAQSDRESSLALDLAANALLQTGAIRPFIIVGIGSSNRTFEYSPFVRLHSTPPEGGGGDAYLAALVNTLKPYIDSHFATLRGPGSTGIVGVSLGGTISVYAGYRHPETFGIVGALSGNYFWDGGYLFEYLRMQSKPRGGSLFVDVGTVEDNLFDARVLDSQARFQGFLPSVDYSYEEVVGSGHYWLSWRSRMPEFLRFFSRRTLVAADSSDNSAGPDADDRRW